MMFIDSYIKGFQLHRTESTTKNDPFDKKFAPICIYEHLYHINSI